MFPLWTLLVLLILRIECIQNSSNLTSSLSSNSTHKKTVVPLPWLENLVKLEAPPTVNKTLALLERRNRTTVEDEIITDADVADIPDDDKQPPINTMVKEGDKTTIHVSEKAGEELYQHWLDQAVSGLMATVATNKLEKVTKKDKIAHKKCAKTAKTVTAHAKCVAALLSVPDVKKEEEKTTTTTTAAPLTTTRRSTTTSQTTPKATTTTTVKKLLKKAMKKSSKSRKSKSKSSSKSSSREGGIRIKMTRRVASERKSSSKEALLRGVKRLKPSDSLALRKYQRLSSRSSSEFGPKRITYHHNSYRKKTQAADRNFRRMKRDLGGFKRITKDHYTIMDVRPKSPISMMAKQMTEAVRAFKNKNKKSKDWQETLEEIAQEGKLLKKKEKVKKLLKKRMQIFTKVMHDVGVDAPEAMDAIDMGVDDDHELTSREELQQEAKEIDEKLSPEDRALREPVKLIREAVKLGLMLKGENVSDFDSKTLKMVSPRIMPLMADEIDKDNNTVNLFSPNLFSLTNETSKHDLFNLAKLMKNLGAGKQGTQELMNFVFEAAGVSDAVGYMKAERVKADQEEAQKHFRDKDGKQQYFNKENFTQIYGEEGKKSVDHIEQLHAMFSQEQFDKLNTTGYVSMTDEQLDFLYGKDSPYNDTEALTMFKNITEHEQHEAIKSAIHSIAKEELKFKIQRRKDVVLSPVMFGAFINNPVGASQAIVLSPVIFTPLITSPAIFGSVILSPWAFVPVIVSPRILGPVVLSPILFAPVILSPLAMVPIILSPGLGVPFVLSPFILSPFVLSPVALTPVILSPFALSPFILVPNLLSPMVLSPFVLSPLILSPPAITAFILNPYALSPIIKSDGFAFTAVLSPSWLS